MMTDFVFDLGKGWGRVKSLFNKPLQVADALYGHFDDLLGHEGAVMADSLTEKLESLSASAHMMYDGLHFPSAGESRDRVTGFGSNIQGYTDELFQHAEKLYPSEKITEFKKSVDSVASRATALYQVVKGVAERRDVPLDLVLEELRNTFHVLFEELKEQFPPPEEAASHKSRMVIINTVLDRIEESFLQVVMKHGASEEHVKSHFSSLKSSIQHSVMIIEDSYEHHGPKFAWILLCILVCILLGILLLYMVVDLCTALRIFGLGPLGPIKGTVAAWLQAWLFGPMIPKGSWFAILQYLAMTLCAVL
ncbi:hypothetical protein EDB19DRAFT_608170 [Suillus lakei]|nr:hypothetical protein EDB19DRAFT_608170 [Suillus lakei]